MTPREIVRRALEFQRPPRMPVWLPSLGVSDDAGIGATDPGAKRFMYECFSRRSEKVYGSRLPEPNPPQERTT